jgi:CARDB protein
MDDDIQFDFFEDEPPTTEAQSSQRVRLPRRGGTGSGMRRPGGPTRGMTPILRLLGAVLVLVVLLLVFGLAIQSCASTSKSAQYKSYMDDVAKIAHSSQDDGTAVANALTTPGKKATDISGALTGIAAQEQQNVAQAEKLSPPGRLRPENQQLIEALRLRVSGVQGMATALGAFTKSSKNADVASVLSSQGDRLLASDVVWSDLFQEPARTQEQSDGVTGAPPPDSSFVQNRQLVTEASMTLLLQRLSGAAASSSGKPTGLHGTNLVATKAMPGSHTLAPAPTVNTITAGTDLAFDVTVHNGGDSQEVGIKVTLTIQQSPAIVKTQTIRLIDPGQDKTVTFTNLGTVKFAQKENINVDVAPVPGEQTVTNNKATYPVIFSLGG